MSAENWALANEPTTDYFLLCKLQRKLDTEAPYAVRLKLRSMKYCSRMVLTNQGNGNVHVLVEECEARRTGEVSRRSRYTSLVHCSSLWACPVCTPYRLRLYANKITALIRRRNKLNETAFMWTLTIPHSRRQSAEEVFGRLADLRQATFGKGSWYYYKKLFGVSGYVQSTECTYSRQYGWHFHYHMLIFLKNGDDINQRVRGLTEKMQKLWNRQWKGELPAYTDMDYWQNKSVYLSENANGEPREIEAGDYLCGYGAMEIAKLSNGSRASMNVFDLLASDDPQDNDLFLEFAVATRGKKRVNMSPGMAKCIQPEDYGLEKVKGAETVTVEKKKRQVVASFTASQWRAFCEMELEAGVGLRAELLDVARKYSFEAALGGIRRWAEIRGLPPDFICAPLAKALQWNEQAAHEQAGFYARPKVKIWA